MKKRMKRLTKKDKKEIINNSEEYYGVLEC